MVIFNKPRSQLIPISKIGSSTLDYCTDYKYLGIILSENGSYKPAITTLANQASKALFMLMCGTSKLSFPKPTVLCHLFDLLEKLISNEAIDPDW